MAQDERDFGEWLDKQGSRQDRIGQLAQTAQNDPFFPWPAGDPETIRRYLWRRGRWPSRVAFEDAVEEWGGTPVRDWIEEDVFGEGNTLPDDVRTRVDAADAAEIYVEAMPDEAHPRGWWRALFWKKA